MLVFVLYLYQTLPQLIPKTTIEFSGLLGENMSKVAAPAEERDEESSNGGPCFTNSFFLLVILGRTTSPGGIAC